MNRCCIDENGPNVAQIHSHGDWPGAFLGAGLAEFNQPLPVQRLKRFRSKFDFELLKALSLAPYKRAAHFEHVCYMQIDEITEGGFGIDRRSDRDVCRYAVSDKEFDCSRACATGRPKPSPTLGLTLG